MAEYRLYVSPIIGNGTEEAPYALKCSLHGDCSQVIMSDPQTGHPLLGWGLAVFYGPDFTTVEADSSLSKMPVVSLGTLWGSVPNRDRNAMTNFMSGKGISTAGIVNSTPMRDVINRIGRFINPNFNIDLEIMQG